mgnify:FL=1
MVGVPAGALVLEYAAFEAAMSRAGLHSDAAKRVWRILNERSKHSAVGCLDESIDGATASDAGAEVDGAHARSAGGAAAGGSGGGFRLAYVLYFIGALMCIAALTFFTMVSWFAIGGFGISIFVALMATGFWYAARYLEHTERYTPSGLLYMVCVSTVPAIVFGVQYSLNMWPKTFPSFFMHGSTSFAWVGMESSLLIASLLVLKSVPYSFLSLLAWVAAVYLCRDLPAGIPGVSRRVAITLSLVLTLALCGASVYCTMLGDALQLEELAATAAAAGSSEHGATIETLSASTASGFGPKWKFLQNVGWWGFTATVLGLVQLFVQLQFMVSNAMSKSVCTALWFTTSLMLVHHWFSLWVWLHTLVVLLQIATARQTFRMCLRLIVGRLSLVVRLAMLVFDALVSGVGLWLYWHPSVRASAVFVDHFVMASGTDLLTQPLVVLGAFYVWLDLMLAAQSIGRANLFVAMAVLEIAMLHAVSFAFWWFEIAAGVPYIPVLVFRIVSNMLLGIVLGTRAGEHVVSTIASLLLIIAIGTLKALKVEYLSRLPAILLPEAESWLAVSFGVWLALIAALSIFRVALMHERPERTRIILMALLAIFVSCFGTYLFDSLCLLAAIPPILLVLVCCSFQDTSSWRSFVSLSALVAVLWAGGFGFLRHVVPTEALIITLSARLCGSFGLWITVGNVLASSKVRHLPAVAHASLIALSQLVLFAVGLVLGEWLLVVCAGSFGMLFALLVLEGRQSLAWLANIVFVLMLVIARVPTALAWSWHVPALTNTMAILGIVFYWCHVFNRTNSRDWRMPRSLGLFFSGLFYTLCQPLFDDVWPLSWTVWLLTPVPMWISLVFVCDQYTRNNRDAIAGVMIAIMIAFAVAIDSWLLYWPPLFLIAVRLLIEPRNVFANIVISAATILVGVLVQRTLVLVIGSPGLFYALAALCFIVLPGAITVPVTLIASGVSIFYVGLKYEELQWTYGTIEQMLGFGNISIIDSFLNPAAVHAAWIAHLEHYSRTAITMLQAVPFIQSLIQWP